MSYVSTFSPGGRSGRHAMTGRGSLMAPGLVLMPRPPYADGRVFFSGAQGLVGCCDAVSGRLVWTRNIIAEFKGKGMYFGFACLLLGVGLGNNLADMEGGRIAGALKGMAL